MPFVPSSFLLVVVRPGAPSSVLVCIDGSSFFPDSELSKSKEGPSDAGDGHHAVPDLRVWTRTNRFRWFVILDLRTTDGFKWPVILLVLDIKSATFFLKLILYTSFIIISLFDLS